MHLPLTNVRLTSVKFALNSKALVVGDSDGHSTIYQLKDMMESTTTITTDSDSMATSIPLLKVIEANLPADSSAKLMLFETDTPVKDEVDVVVGGSPREGFVER